MGESIAVIGNFPYNISSQIFFRVLENRDRVREVVCMVQKEVAERICSAPGSRVYGILSVLLRAWYDIEYLFTVSEAVFSPPPKVKSAVIRLKRNKRSKLGCDEELFISVVKRCFNQRRKMLRNPLKMMVKPDAGDMAYLSMRAEQLSVENFEELTCWVAENR
jgi:16S rRNA (adenine1518-N6/adenine1519-N6)-dimethyltransferase